MTTTRMTDFERELRREGRALGRKGVTYSICPSYPDDPEYWSVTPCADGYPLTDGECTREAAIAWCVRDAGEG